MEAYVRFVLENAPRMLSNIDRRRQSPTYGCADRNYWHYKIVDFPCAMLQETCLTLAQLYTIDFPGNIYYSRDAIREWALAAIDFWTKIQKKDGSFDEFYPKEHSFSPAAFTLYATCMAYRLLKLERPDIVAHAQKSTRFLLSYGDPGAGNQRVAAIAGIYAYYLISNDQSVRGELDGLISTVLEQQRSEGWMPEYKGPDIGYQSITLGYLTDYYRLSKDERVRDPIKSMIHFLSHFVHPDGSAGGEYGSRNTSYLAPHGFEINGQEIPLARAIAEKVFLHANPKVNVALDDRYICHFILPSYLTAIEHYSETRNRVDLPCEQTLERYFRECKIFVKSTEEYYFICNLQKGGVYKLFSKRGGSFSDTGYVLAQRKTLAISNWIDVHADIEVDGNRLEIRGLFHKMMTRVPTPFWHFMLRFVSTFLGRKVLPLLKRRFILREDAINVKLERVIEFRDDEIDVTDRVRSEDERPFDLYEADTLSYRYVAPTNYFSAEELTDLNAKRERMGKQVKHLSIEKRITTCPWSVRKWKKEG